MSFASEGGTNAKSASGTGPLSSVVVKVVVISSSIGMRAAPLIM
jgi:hypothetical protein